MLSYYEIPSNVHYVQSIKEIETWTKVSNIQYNVPTVVVIEDSKATHYTRFIVVYKGMMQTQGGSGSCYNPTKRTFIHNQNPMDNSIMPAHMSKWKVYNYTHLLQMVALAKHELLCKMGYKEQLPFFSFNCENYNDLVGILIAKLDLIGLNKANPSIIKEVRNNRKQLLLSM